jgi:hypothetical protein
LELFAQDDWKATRRLKINYGLRYDLYQIPKADPTSPLPASRKFNVDKTNFAPRLAVVYTLREGRRPTILRAGAGIYYDAPLLLMYKRAIQNNGNPKFLTVTFTPTTQYRPAFPNTFSGTLPPGSPPPSDIDAIAPDLKNMYAINTHLQLEQAITEDLSFAVGVRSFGRSPYTDLPQCQLLADRWNAGRRQAALRACDPSDNFDKYLHEKSFSSVQFYPNGRGRWSIPVRRFEFGSDSAIFTGVPA